MNSQTAGEAPANPAWLPRPMADGLNRANLPSLAVRAISPEMVSETELVALVNIRLAVKLWHRDGGGRRALAHRLAASVLLSLINAEPRRWRLSPLVRDIVALGEAALPESLIALAELVEPLAGRPYQEAVTGAAGSPDIAEKRFQDVVQLAKVIAREVSALP